MTHLYIGNLDLGTTEPVIREMLAPFGDVSTVTLSYDPRTGSSRSFAFAEMDASGAARAIQGLNGRALRTRTLHVCNAYPNAVRRTKPAAECNGAHERFGNARPSQVRRRMRADYDHAFAELVSATTNLHSLQAISVTEHVAVSEAVARFRQAERLYRRRRNTLADHMQGNQANAQPARDN